ncbi:adhesion G-protein coupled receptor G6 isoform X2 [Engraulis encrasicolus]|uniref:adhesion G-protein coupled receptor G6 isoform X2 n=1 Tax=Engraulis encrasicolus TaxID=184585 RepID=UPI002FD54E22
MLLEITGKWWRWKVQLFLPFALHLIHLQQSVMSCADNCNLVLTNVQGGFTSPRYPSDYPQSCSCKWTLLAPAGFIVQIHFADFELEEALGCIYDKVIVNTGPSQEMRFCGLTANGLTLNSSGNLMEVSFNSDFSVQKKGFSITYKQVAVALRNQKVALPGTLKDVVKVSSGVSLLPLSQFTVCFEIARSGDRNVEMIFSVSSGSGYGLAFGKTKSGMTLIINSQECSINGFIKSTDITSTMKTLCLTFSSDTGRVSLQFEGNYRSKVCSKLKQEDAKFQGLQLGAAVAGSSSSSSSEESDDIESFDGFIYNFRLWSQAMTSSELSSLTCDSTGDLIDWDNSFWDIPSSYARTDASLSCSTSTPTLPSETTTSCSYPNPGCPAKTSPVLITTVVPAITHPSTISATSTLSTTVNGRTSTTTNQSPQETFFRISLSATTADVDWSEADVKTNLTDWLKQTLQGAQVNDTRVQPDGVSQLKSTTVRFNCQALVVFKMIVDEMDIENSLRNSKTSGLDVEAGTIKVKTVEYCPAEENPSHYKWPKTNPTETVDVLCFPYKEQNASRTCLINMNNYTASWTEPDLTNCTDIDEIKVSEENAAEVAVQLADISTNELSTTEVTKVVTKVKELVAVARINATLAGTVLDIISNVMATPVPTQAATSETALRAVDQLVQKIEFEGPNFNISTKNLALGLSALNATEFNGTTFSAFISPNTTDPQIAFETEAQNPLAVVILPATLLNNLSIAHIEAISRINFIFFSKTGFFQDDVRDGLSLNSYVVASSVGNLTIRNLRDPVRIEIAHLQHKPESKRSCVFWDFTIKNGTGGWNSDGCQVSPDSSDNRTVCLCNHLTHFGILMDISRTSAQIDYQNTRVLTFITYIGCGVSAIFSAVTLLTYITFEKLRRDYPAKILMNLSTSLLLLNMVFLLDGWLASFGMEALCITVAVFMHFFLLTSFTWMGLESIHMYIALVKVFNTYIRRYILKFCLVGWGLPAAIVCTVVAIDKHSYGMEYYGRDDNGQESSKFCWIRSTTVFYVTCVGYFSVIFLMNVAMFIVVMIQICGRNGKRSNRTLREEVLRNLRSVISLTFLLGMTWGFAFFAWGPVNLAFMYLFSIFNSLQGLFIFVFHCALKENVQKQWRRYLCCAQLRLADNSDWSNTKTNNTKKVSSDNLGKSLSSSSFSSSTANWTSKAKATLNPFSNYNNSAGHL